MIRAVASEDSPYFRRGVRRAARSPHVRRELGQLVHRDRQLPQRRHQHEGLDLHREPEVIRAILACV